MSALFRGLVLGHLRSNRLRALVTLVAVGLGVAISLAIDLANATAVASFASSVNVVANHVNLQVLGVGRGFDERALVRVQDVDGVQYASPTIEESVVVGARAGDPFSGEILRVLGIDLLAAAAAEIAARTCGSPRRIRRERQGARSLRARSPAAAPSSRIASPNATVSSPGRRSKRSPAIGRCAFAWPPSCPPRCPASIRASCSSTSRRRKRSSGRSVCSIASTSSPTIRRLPAVQRAVAAVLPHGARAIEPARAHERDQAHAAQLPVESRGALLHRDARRHVSHLQYRRDLGRAAPSRSRDAARARRDARRRFSARSSRKARSSAWPGRSLGLVARERPRATCRSAPSRAPSIRCTWRRTPTASSTIRSCCSKRSSSASVLATLSALVPALEAASTAPAITMRAQGFERRRARPGVGSRARRSSRCFAAAYLADARARDRRHSGLGYAAGLADHFRRFALRAARDRGRRARRSRAHRARLARGLRSARPTSAPRSRRNSVAVASLMVAIAMMVSVAILIGSFRTTVVAWADETLKADLFVRPLGLAGRELRRALLAARRRDDRARFRASPPSTRSARSRFRFAGSLTTLAAADFETIADRNKLRFLGDVDTRALARTNCRARTAS